MTPALRETFAAKAASQHGAIDLYQLSAIGWSRSAVRNAVGQGILLPRGRGVFVVAGSAGTWLQRLWVALLEAGPGAIASHRSSAALKKIPGFPEGPVDITVHERFRHPVRHSNLAVTSWLPADQITIVQGIPTSSLARCVFELAGWSSSNRLARSLPFVHELQVERTYDNATKLGLTYQNAAEVLATLGKRGRRGTALMRRILEPRGEGYVCTDSELEDLTLKVLAANDLPLPTPQRKTGDEHNDIGRVDFLYEPPYKPLVLEAQSLKHHSALLESRNDHTRALKLVAAGYDYLEVTHWDLVGQPWIFCGAVKQKLGV
jgi:hypothetical protein